MYSTTVFGAYAVAPPVGCVIANDPSGMLRGSGQTALKYNRRESLFIMKLTTTIPNQLIPPKNQEVFAN